MRWLGRRINNAVVRFPSLWPLLRRPVGRFFDRAAPGWDERVQPDSPEHLEPLAVALEALERQPERVLDVGTGTGAGAFLLVSMFPDAEVVGVDLSEEMVARARAKGRELPETARISFEVADVASLDAPDGSFDLVVMLNMPPFFDEVDRLLSHGGYVVSASSLGPRTPFYTSSKVLERGFGRKGLRTIAAGTAGTGSYYLAERAPAVG